MSLLCKTCFSTLYPSIIIFIVITLLIVINIESIIANFIKHYYLNSILEYFLSEYEAAMSQLIQLRQRIKAVNTIKKITHTMRLIAMSSHSRLRAKEEALKEYLNITHSLFHKIKPYASDWKNPFGQSKQEGKTLIVLIGSQRGLCGNFNSILFHFFERIILPQEKNSIIIPVGKKAVRYCELKPTLKINNKYPEISSKTLPFIAQDIKDHLLIHKNSYHSVMVVSNTLKTFFVQRPQKTVIIPFEISEKNQKNSSKEDYYWDQSPQELLDNLTYQLIENQLHYLLFQSLLAEQAARFLSMDNATRNVQHMLDDTQLQYNKLRQFKITKEITELSFNL